MSSIYWFIISISTVFSGIANLAHSDISNDVIKLKESKKCPFCNLNGADLSGINLSKADLKSAKLNGASFETTADDENKNKVTKTILMIFIFLKKYFIEVLSFNIPNSYKS